MICSLTNDASSSNVARSSNRQRACTKKCIRIDSCENGDTVLVVWNDALHRYIIAQVISNELFCKEKMILIFGQFPQDSVYLHFLAEDSHPLFDLPVPNTKEVTFENIPKPAYFLAMVTDKQYCMVKKEGTRYRVPIGTKFFRIKVKPLSANNRSSIEIDKNTKKDGTIHIHLNDPFKQ